MKKSDDLKKSREYEMRMYLNSMGTMYQNALAQNGDIYDIAFDLTKAFRKITPRAVLTDSRLIKVLRYAVAPSISQMKFGQLFGLTSIDKLETDKLSVGSFRYKQLKRFAKLIADFAKNNIDRSRFIWLDRPSSKSDLAYSFSRKWTCSIAADQNAQTAYRKWRKNQQEQAVVKELVSMGYIKSGFSGVIKRDTDIKIGEFTQEIRVRGRTTQKADIAVRSKLSKKLVLIEAKAVGVEIDATKRIKECCDKANDWGAGPRLLDPDVVAVIAGFFNKSNLANLKASGIYITWEHRLRDLAKRV